MTEIAAARLEDYKLKVSFAVEQTNRMQTQFQVMLTLESLLATTLIVSNTGSLTSGAKWIAALEFWLSVAWLMVGKAGRDKARAHRADLVAAGEKWAAEADLGADYKPVGDGTKVPIVGVLAPLALTIGWAILFVVFFFATI